MSSIQARLTISLTFAAIVLSALAGCALHHALGGILVRQFDRTLQDKARGLSLLVSRELNGRLEFEYAPKAMPEYQRYVHAEYFQVQFEDGTVYVESQSLGGKLLPQFPADGAARDIVLPTGRIGRVVSQRFFPRPEDEIEPLPRPLSEIPHLAAGKQMVITMARDRAELDGALRELTECIILSAVCLALVTAATSIWIVHRALMPLRTVAHQAGTIDTRKLDRGFPQSNLPLELQPICSRLNDLLRRIDEVLQRERRFTADVAHELRTPIAELRSVTEVALKWSDDTAGTLHALSDSHAIALQMEMLVKTLLSLVRSDGAISENLQKVPVSLTHELRRASESLQHASVPCPVQIESERDAFVLVEPVLLNSVLTNLLSNAIEYKVQKSDVICRIEVTSDRCQLIIDNQMKGLTQDDVNHMFEPFWRKDRSRTGTAHAGLGLALVRNFCNLMDVRITASMPEPFVLRMVLSFQAMPPPPDDPKPADTLHEIPLPTSVST